MKLTVRLEDRSLYRVARLVNKHARRLQRTLINRLTENRNFAVWELPYANPEATKEFIGALRSTFPPDIMPEVLLFLNNGYGGSFKCYLAAGFPEAVFPTVQPTLNTQVVGVMRDFSLSPDLLIAMSIQGIFEMETNLTPSKVDRAYGQPRRA